MRRLRSSTCGQYLTLGLWLAFLAGTGLLFVLDSLAPIPPLLTAALLLGLLLAGLALLIRYSRVVAQWRAVLLFWLIYVLAYLLAERASAARSSFLLLLSLLLVLYAVLAAWFAVAALAVRRDVSVAYLVISIIAVPILFARQIQAAGGLLAMFQAMQPDSQVLAPFEPSSALVAVLWCLPPLALLTFILHFLHLCMKEWRREPL